MNWSEYNTAFSVANILIQLYTAIFNPLNAELNPICHLLALLGAHHILHVSRIRVKWILYYWPWRWPYWVETYFMFCWPASLYNLFQMKPTRCTLLLSIFISASLHVSGNYVPIVRRTYCINATLVFFTLYGWLSGLLFGMCLILTNRPDSHPYRVKNTSIA